MGTERVHNVGYRLSNSLLDVFVISVAFLGGCLTRHFFPGESMQLLEKFDETSILIWYLLFYLTNFFFIAFYRLYHHTRLRSMAVISSLYAKSVFSALVCAVIVTFLYPYFPTSRLLLISASIYCFLLLLLKEVLFRIVLRMLRSKGYFAKRAVIVGDDFEEAKAILSESISDHLLGLKVVAQIGTEEAASPVHEDLHWYPLPEMSSVLDREQVATAIFVMRKDDEKFDDAVFQCQERGVEVWYRMALLDKLINKAGIEYCNEMAFLNLRVEPPNAGALFFKYTCDKLLASVALIVLLPFLCFIALLVRLTSPGPVIFRQKRTGLNGNQFYIYKFRSMYIDADESREQLLVENELEGPAFKLRSDPRVSPLGRVLRKFSIDELPQLWNIVRGEMSLVGPRPLRVEEAELITSWHKRRQSMRPGLTCIWQVSGRSSIVDFDRWVELDLKYIDNWSLWLDLKILLKTIPVVLTGYGAH